MKVIAERIISYLKADSTLVDLLGDARNIYARSLNEKDNRPGKFVCIEASLGEDLNYTDAQQDDFDVEIAVSRKEADAYSTAMDIMGRVDDLLNKNEDNLYTASWKILDIHRVGSPTRGILIDDKTNEYYALVRYSYILDEN